MGGPGRCVFRTSEPLRTPVSWPGAVSSGQTWEGRQRDPPGVCSGLPGLPGMRVTTSSTHSRASRMHTSNCTANGRSSLGPTPSSPGSPGPVLASVPSPQSPNAAATVRFSTGPSTPCSNQTIDWPSSESCCRPCQRPRSRPLSPPRHRESQSSSPASRRPRQSEPQELSRSPSRRSRMSLRGRYCAETSPAPDDRGDCGVRCLVVSWIGSIFHQVLRTRRGAVESLGRPNSSTSLLTRSRQQRSGWLKISIQ